MRPTITGAKHFLFILIFCIIFTSCNTKIESPTPVNLPSQSVISTSIPSQAVVTPTPQQKVTKEILPTSKPLCYKDTVPSSIEKSAAAQGWNQFAKENNINSRFMYFPPDCSRVSAEQDLEQLFFSHIVKADEIVILFLEPSTEGTLGRLYAHLQLFGFWAMGPEDYPVVLDKRSDIETNIIIIRTDRMDGEGKEGNALLSMMKGMAEHEYIHTIEARNNLDLAEMIWTDEVYRAFMERYTNLRNNAGQWYNKASPTMLGLLQFLDGLNTQGLLEPKATAIINEKGLDVDSFLNRSVVIYNSHIIALIQTVADKDKTYLDKLKAGKINPLALVSMAGSGDIEAYDVIQKLYNDNIKEYNQWYYSSKEDQYMPATFSELFSSK